MFTHRIVHDDRLLKVIFSDYSLKNTFREKMLLFDSDN